MYIEANSKNRLQFQIANASPLGFLDMQWILLIVIFVL